MAFSRPASLPLYLRFELNLFPNLTSTLCIHLLPSFSSTFQISLAAHKTTIMVTPCSFNLNIQVIWLGFRLKVSGHPIIFEWEKTIWVSAALMAGSSYYIGRLVCIKLCPPYTIFLSLSLSPLFLSLSLSLSPLTHTQFHPLSLILTRTQTHTHTHTFPL